MSMIQLLLTVRKLKCQHCFKLETGSPLSVIHDNGLPNMHDWFYFTKFSLFNSPKNIQLKSAQDLHITNH